jgi:hypothetical protein
MIAEYIIDCSAIRGGLPLWAEEEDLSQDCFETQGVVALAFD